MNERVSWEFFRVHSDELTRMTLIRTGNLQSKTALGAANQDGLALAQVMEPLEEMNAAQRNALSSSTVGTRKRNLPEPCQHDHPGAGCQAGRKAAIGR